MKAIRHEKIAKLKSMRLSYVLYSFGIGYLLACTALLLYPPFSIPVALACAAFLFGDLFDHWRKDKLSVKEVFQRLSPLVIGVFMGVLLIVPYFLLHKAMIHETTATIYPGHRITQSGDLPRLAVFDGFLMPVLQSVSKGVHYYTNQSEASSFIFLAPFLLLPSIVLQVIDYRKNKRFSWVLILTNTCLILFFVRSLVPFNTPFYKLLLLDKVPNIRLKAGMGFLGMLQLVLLIAMIPLIKLHRKTLLLIATVSGLCSLATMLYFAHQVSVRYPLFLHSILIAGILATAIALVVFLFVYDKPVWAGLLLLVFTLGSGFRILPLYRGLGILQSSNLVNAIRTDSKPGDNWVTIGDLIYSNLPLAAGRNDLSGTQEYPDFTLWDQIDNGKYNDIYNRQAKVIFTDDVSQPEPIKLLQQNYFSVRFSCSQFIKNNVDYVLSTQALNHPCTKQVDTVTYPNKTFFIYQVIP